MTTKSEFSAALLDLDLGPLQVEVESDEPSRRGGAYLTLRWGQTPERFAVEFKQARALRDVRNAAWQARSRAAETGRRALLVVPFLNDEALAFLEAEGVSGLDLSGNGIVEVPGRWRFFQRGFPSRFPTQRKSRSPYRGKSALVGRALIARPEYSTVSEVQEEIARRGGTLSLSQVSKVLLALEDDLVIRKTRDGTSEGIRLLQPKKLLDGLAEAYRLAQPAHALETKAELGPRLFERLTARAAEAGARIAGFEPQRYVIAPQSRERLTVYVESTVGPDLARVFGLDPVARFSNLDIRVMDEPGVYFDLEEDSGFRWCSRLEVYLQLMQGGKREQETALQLRDDLLTQSAVGKL